MIRATLAAVVLLGAAEATAQPFLTVPYVYTRSPAVFHDLFARARCGTVRAILLGDSQETSPGGGGIVYMPRLQSEFWSRIGNVPETPWMTLGLNYGDGAPYADWVHRGTNTIGGVTASRVPPERLPPGFNAVKTSTTDGANVNENQVYGNLLLLDHDGASLDPATGLRGADVYFDRTDQIYLDVMAATNPSSGEIRVRVTPAPGPATGFFYPTSATFDSAIGLESPTPGVGVFRCGPLPMGSGVYMQVALAGTDPAKFTDLLSARFVNGVDARGWAMSSLSAGGYGCRHMLWNHAECADVLGAIAPDVALICLGANDAPFRTAEELRGDLEALIAFVRAGTRPDLPVILASDPARLGLSPAWQQEYDSHSNAAYAVALGDPLVCALNSRRLTHEAGWTTAAVQTYAPDGVHANAAGATLKASVEAGALFGAFMMTPADCNGNGIDDGCDIAGGTSVDANGDRVPDECVCDPDVTCDGNADQNDVACMIDAVAGNPGCECADPDFNRDGNVDQGDVAAVIDVVAGGNCP